MNTAKQCRNCYIKTNKNKKHSAWKGGKPKCLDCGKQLSNYKNKKYKSCIKKNKTTSRKFSEIEAIKNGNILGWIKYKIFRLKALIRDNYTCKKCKKYGNSIHHKKPKEQYPKMCFWFSNVITLCRSCHTILHKKGKLK